MEITISIIALVVSVFSAGGTFFAIAQNRSINNTNLEAMYYEKIFTEYITYKIPENVEKIQFRDNKLETSYRELNDIMMEMIRNSKYYAYAKKKFYQELRDATMALEDKLILTANREISNVDEQEKFKYSVHQDIADIIKLINRNYHKF